MKEEQPDNAEHGYKCSRCGGTFGDEGKSVVHCPFCSMICDATTCQTVMTSNEEY